MFPFLSPCILPHKHSLFYKNILLCPVNCHADSSFNSICSVTLFFFLRNLSKFFTFRSCAIFLISCCTFFYYFSKIICLNNICLNIDDNYEFMDRELQELLESLVYDYIS